MGLQYIMSLLQYIMSLVTIPACILLTLVQAKDRIVGGEDADPGEFPHQVALLVVDPGHQFHCGGTLITSSIVLTAGHCCHGQDISHLSVRVGGPIMCGDQVSGIVSTGRGCALPGYPGIYTQTSYFTDWITAMVEIINKRDREHKIVMTINT